MRQQALILLLIVAIAATLGYCLISPTYLGDYRWIVLALPVSLLLVREFFDYLPGTTNHDNQWYEMAIVPDDEEDSEDEADEYQLKGLWMGSACLRGERPDGQIHLLPLRLAFFGNQDDRCIVSSSANDQGMSVVAADVVEFDPCNGNLDLELAVADHESVRHYEVRLARKGRRFIPEDDTECVTAELAPARLIPADALEE